VIGENLLIINHETICMMVQEYLNAHTVQKGVVVKKLELREIVDYQGQSNPPKKWVATITPADVAPESPPAVKEAP